MNKFMIDFMVDAVKVFSLQEQVVIKPWQRKRTPRQDVGTLTLAPGSPQYPHHRYEDFVDVRQKFLDYERSLKRPMPLPSTSRGDDNQEITPKKRRLDFALYEEDLEQRRSKGIVIRDRESEPEKKMKKNKEKYTDDIDDVSKAEKKAMKKKKKERDMQAVLDLPEPELPEKLRARMKEIAEEFNDKSFDDKSAVCVIQKVLPKSDINRQQNRLTIPKKQARVEFLNPDEESYLSEKHEKHTNYINVPIIEPTGGTPLLTLRKWNVGKKSVSYVLNGDWMDVVSLNQLEEGQIVQVWAFRILGRLYLAFVFSEKKPKQEEASTSQALAVVEPQAAPLLLTQGETTTTEDEIETAGSSGCEESNKRSGGLSFDLNMDPDEF